MAFEGKNVLVTGGAGSVGRRLVKHSLSEGARVVRILDNNEPSLAGLREELDDSRCRFLLGDIRDDERLHRAMEDIDIVVHAAALKHVDFSEYNPFEAVKTNIMGLQNVVDVAIEEEVEKMVFTSSDKAVNPANTMGTTKLMGEKLITAGNKYRGEADITLSSVRFGNVIGSSQSVIPIFKEQIRKRGPVQLTDKKMTRFFLTFSQISELITRAIEKSEGGEIFLRKMSAIKIEDLAEVMIEVFAPKFGYNPGEIDIEVNGKKPGETFHEHIMTEIEARRAVENEKFYAVLPDGSDGEYLHHSGLEGFEQAESIIKSSKNADKLDKSEIRKLLSRGGVIE